MALARDRSGKQQAGDDSVHRTVSGRLAYLTQLTRRGVFWIDDFRGFGVQLPKPIDQWFGRRRALVSRFTHWMVPCNCPNTGIREYRADRRYTGLQCQLRTLSKIEQAFLRISRWRFGMDERPATIKHGGSKCRRNIACPEISRAEGRHEQNELQIRHPRILDIQRRHGRALSMATGTESTGPLLLPPTWVSYINMRSVRP